MTRTRPRPLSTAQRLENAAFLAALVQTGNAREAARQTGLHRATLMKRRNKHPAFALEWDAALARAQARLAGKGAGSPQVVRYRDGRVQVRTPASRTIGHEARQRFLLALAASADVRLAARAAGFAHASFYALKRKDTLFAQEWHDALEIGYLRLELALIEGFRGEPGLADEWRRNEPAAIPPMSPAEALQLMYLHQKEARLWATPGPMRKRRGETNEIRAIRLQLTYEAQMAHQRALFDRAEAAREAARGKAAKRQHQPAPVVLPDLAQVRGWSNAGESPSHNQTRALFGGWRLGMGEGE